MLVFKGKQFTNLESKLKKHHLVESGKIIDACQMNAWVDEKLLIYGLKKYGFEAMIFVKFLIPFCIWTPFLHI